MNPSPVPNHRFTPISSRSIHLPRFNRFSLTSIVMLGLVVSNSQHFVHAGGDDTRFETEVVQSTAIPAFSDSILSYFPLQTGNFWQYGIHYEPAWCPGNYDTTYYSLEVTGDTLMSNGYTYKILGGHYYRIDTSLANVYWLGDVYECLSDSLRADAGNYFESCGGPTECAFVETINVLGIATTAKHFGGVFWTSALALGFGRIQMAEGVPWICDYWIVHDLFYARIDGVEYGTLVDVQEEPGLIPESFELAQNYPNPFNPSTTIEYALPRSSYVKLEVFNVLGEMTRVLRDGLQDAGYHSVVFDADGLPSGIYFYRLKAEDFAETKKLILMR